VLIPEGKENELIEAVTGFKSMSRAEFSITEPAMEMTINEVPVPDVVIDNESFTELVNAIYGCPHGVIAMSQSIDDFVETSTNLASVKFQEDEILITTSQRSSVESEKQDITNMVTSVFKLAGARTETSDGYPGWTPNPDSDVVKITVDSYKKLFNTSSITSVNYICITRNCPFFCHRFTNQVYYASNSSRSIYQRSRSLYDLNTFYTIFINHIWMVS